MKQFKLTRAHLTVVVILLAAVLVAVTLLHSTFGIIKNPDATRYTYDGVVVGLVIVLILSQKIKKDEAAARKAKEDEASGNTDAGENPAKPDAPSEP